VTRIHWLASYPKSGNTWVRILLANYLEDGDRPVDINTLDKASIVSARELNDMALGVDTADLTHEESASLRAAAVRAHARRHSGMLYLKIHDAYTVCENGEPLIPADVSAGVVYIARNPLDVAPSAARHWSISLDKALEWLESSVTLSQGRRKLDRQLPQRLLTWSGHVESWLDQTAIPVHLVRYEDLHRDPVGEMMAMLRFWGLPGDEGRAAKAVEFSSFEQLAAQEKKHGFREKPAGTGAFFGQGQAGGWRGRLTPEQVTKVVETQGRVMRRLGYLDGPEP